MGFRSIWKLKIPNKIKAFLWLVTKNSILTWDNLIRRGWTGNEECFFCGSKERIDHLFFDCVLAKMIFLVVTFSFGIPTIPSSLSDMMGGWIRTFPKK